MGNCKIVEAFLPALQHSTPGTPLGAQCYPLSITLAATAQTPFGLDQKSRFQLIMSTAFLKCLEVYN